MKVRTLLCVCALLFSLTVAAQFQPERYPKREFRAAWIQAVNGQFRGIPTEKLKQTLISQLNSLQEAGINAIIFQVRPEADALYASQLEPWSRFLTGVQGQAPNPYWDPMEFMIEECHKRGMEFHAWINPYRVKNKLDDELASTHIYNRHPEWFVVYGDQLFFDPALPESREHICRVVGDIVRRYDIDAIHMDDYFYPYPASGVELDDQQDFMEYGKEFDNIEDFRRDNVNKAIEAVHNLIVEKRPDVVFSISPYGVWRNKADDPDGSDSSSSITNYDDLYADIRLWCEKGWIDMVVPQLYASTENIAMNFIKMTDWWANNSFDCPVVIGHGVYKFGNPAEGEIFMDPVQLETQFFYARREANVDGSFIFNASVFKNNKIGILDNLGKVYADKALIPFMGRETAPEPKPVGNLAASGKSLSWESQGEGIRYVVYKINDKEAKIADVVDTNSYVCVEPGDYAVSALNDDNAESNISSVLTIK